MAPCVCGSPTLGPQIATTRDVTNGIPLFDESLRFHVSAPRARLMRYRFDGGLGRRLGDAHPTPIEDELEAEPELVGEGVAGLRTCSTVSSTRCGYALCGNASIISLASAWVSSPV